MHVEQTANELVIRETPGCLWMFAALFGLVGGVFVYGALGGLADYQSQSAWMLALAFVMGAVGITVGIWIIYRAPITKITFFRTEQIILLTRFGLFGRREIFYDFDEIKQLCLTEERDSEGDPIWYFAIQLVNKKLIKITSLAAHSEEYQSQYVFQANEFMNKQIAPPMILELQDENEA